MKEVETLPLIDTDSGIIVRSLNVDSYSAGTGWYVHQIPDKTDTWYGRWRQSDQLTKWCDEELVRVPDSLLSDEPTSEEVLSLAKEYVFDKGVSFCSRCETAVAVGSLETDSGYVATVCGECKDSCTECDAEAWESLGRKHAHSTTSPPRWKCTECGHIKKGITTG